MRTETGKSDPIFNDDNPEDYDDDDDVDSETRRQRR